MTERGVSISFGNLVVGAKEAFDVSATEKADFVDLTDLQNDLVSASNYGNPCEPYQTVLDGKMLVLPTDPFYSNARLGFWSEQISDDNGNFAKPITLTLRSEDLFTTPGITFTFDKYNETYPLQVEILWYRVIGGNSQFLDSKIFRPDNSIFFCENKVELFNMIVISFNSINMPRNRLRLSRIDYGFGKVFPANEVRNVSIAQEHSPIFDTITIGTADFTLESKTNMDYSFMEKQQVEISFNGKLKSVCYVKTSKRMAKNIWNFHCEDVVGVLEDTPFFGGVYENELAVNIIRNICAVAHVEIAFASSVISKEERVSGYIPYTTCRDALRHVLFATQIDLNRHSSKILVFKENTYNNIAQHISANRIMQGQSFSDNKKVTSIEITSHKYLKTTEEAEIYSAEKKGTGENIFVKFTEPLHDLRIINGTILSRGFNFAKINASTDCVLVGQKYEHQTKIHQKGIYPTNNSSAENVLSITDATLVSSNNIDNVIDKCYNWLIRNRDVQMKIIESPKQEEVVLGQLLSFDTEYLGESEGVLIQQKYNLNGGIIVKDVRLR